MVDKARREEIRESHPDSWIAVEEGDYITGQLVDVTDAWSDQRQGGSYYPLLTIKTASAPGYKPGANLLVHCFSTILFNEVMRHRPEVGEKVTILYRGQGEAKVGRNAPELYRVTVEGRKDQAQRAYGRIAGEPATAAQPAAPAQTAGPQYTQTELEADQAAEDLPF